MFPSTHLKPARRLLVASALLFASQPLVVSAQTSPPLGQAASFAVLGGSTATNTGAANVVGNLGVAPGTAVTGFPPGIVSGGTIHINNAVAQQAQSDLTIAYNNLAGQAPTVDLRGQNLGGLTLGPGSNIAGNILALSSITLTTSANLSGRALARNGAVTLDTNTVAVWAGGCAPINLAPTTVPNASLSQPYSQTLTATGGIAPYTYSVTAGTLPPGLNPSAAGLIAGTPTSAGTFSFLTLSPADLLTGTPTTLGNFNFTITATDAASCPGSRPYAIAITVGGPGPGPTPIVRNVPTLSTWALALMALLTIAVVAGVGRRPG